MHHRVRKRAEQFLLKVPVRNKIKQVSSKAYKAPRRSHATIVRMTVEQAALADTRSQRRGRCRLRFYSCKTSLNQLQQYNDREPSQ